MRSPFIFLFLFFAGIYSGCGAEITTPKALTSSVKTAPKTFERSEHYGEVSQKNSLTDEERAIIINAGASECKMDPKLSAAARKHASDISDRNGSRKSADIDHLRFALLASGSTDYLIQPFLAKLNEDGISALSRFVSTHGGEWTHCGLGVGGNLKNKTLVWIGVHRSVSLKPIPVSVYRGESFKIIGKVNTAKVAGVSAYLGLPNGDVRPLIVQPQSIDSFIIEFTPTINGRFDLELAVDSGRGPETVSLIPLYVGIPPETRPIVILDDSPEVGDKKNDQLLTSLINDIRVKIGLPPLLRSSKLDAVAKNHSRDMVRLNYFGHRSPNGLVLADRLRAKNLFPSKSAENVARSGSLRRVHRNIVQSPSHRLKLLSDRFTHLGVGVIKDGSDIVVTEILVRW